VKLRSHVQLLVIGTLLPMIVFAIYGAFLLTQRERDTFERGATERVRAVLTAVDLELKGSITSLLAIASRGAIAQDDLRGIHAELVGALRTQPDWIGLSLADTSGQQLVNASYPYGEPLPATREWASLQRVLITGEPAIGDLLPGAPPHGQQFSVRVPVRADGAVKYVLSAAVKPEAINALLMAQRLPPEWVGVVLDGTNRFVARTKDPDRNVGQLASESLRAELTARDEGWFRGATIEGRGVYTPFSRSRTTGWSVALGIPSEVVDAARLDAAIFLLLGTAVTGLVAFGLAVWLGRRFWDPITGLAFAARGIERGAWPAIPVSVEVDEVAELGRALRNSVEELRRVTEAQRQAIEQLRVSDRAKDDFLAMLGHELRNPMAGIAGASSILSSPRVPDEMAERARTILRRQVENLSRLLDDMLDMSRSAAGKITLVRRPVDLSHVVNAALNTFRSSGRLQHHDVSVVDSPTVWIDADEGRMEQLVSNLIGNAIKYTPAGGSIAVKVEAEDSNAVLTVADSGRGIPAHLLDRVFDPFVQGSQSAERAQGGLGLGLALVKALVELHGGSVRAHSEGTDLGSTFTVHLPRIVDVERVNTQGAPRPRDRSASRSILVIEDNADGREMLRAVLAMAGHDVHVAPDGPSGLAAAAELSPDVALIDIAMPGMDGHEVARRLRATDKGKAMRLVAISGFGQPADRQRSLEAGFDAHLIKPFAVEALSDFLA
jgi:signal transduction histidine kinase